jgi:hypothetical protein
MSELCLSQDNLSDKDVNQGTLVVFNLDSSISNDDLHQIFGVYGEIKEVIFEFFLKKEKFFSILLWRNFFFLYFSLVITDKGGATEV